MNESQSTWPETSTLKILTAMAAALCMLLWGCGTATVTGQQAVLPAPSTSSGQAPVAKPGIVYVADFDLDAATIQSEAGLLSKPKLHGPLNNLVPPPPVVSKDPQKLARELIDSLGDSLVKDLNITQTASKISAEVVQRTLQTPGVHAAASY